MGEKLAKGTQAQEMLTVLGFRTHLLVTRVNTKLRDMAFVRRKKPPEERERTTSTD